MFINSSHRILYGSLAALLVLSAPAYAQGHGGSRPPSQSSSAHPGQSAPQSQPGPPQSAPPSSGIKTYPGQDSYRSGVRPPEVQQRYDARRDRSEYRQTYRAERRYDVRPYVRPRGWYSRNWVIGDLLPSLFWSRTY